MDRKRFKPEADSNYMINQCAARLNDGADRISPLPDDIVVVILSFLSLREAAATSVLSSRWLHLWKHTPNLNFIAYKLKLDSHMSTAESKRLWDAERCKYIQLVNSVIKSHKAPSLKQFAISFYMGQSAKCIVAKWLQFAFSRGVERLVFDVLFIQRRDEVVVEELLRESGLCSSPQTLILFKSLKRLCIKHVNVSGEAVKIFLLNCPLLERLIIGFSIVTSDVEVCGATLVLKHLEMSRCHGGKSLRVSAPNLTRLNFSDRLGKLILESVPKLVKAEFRFQSQCADVLQNATPALFYLSSQLKILDLFLIWPKEFLANEFPEMPNLRKLVVKYCGPKTHSFLPVTALLWASPRLQEFKIQCCDIQNGDAPIQVRRNGESPHLHLKLFELMGLVDGADGQIELVNYISDNCVGLEKIKISPSRGLASLARVDGGGDASPIIDHKQAARNYAQQRLQGKLPQRIQLQIS